MFKINSYISMSFENGITVSINPSYDGTLVSVCCWEDKYVSDKDKFITKEVMGTVPGWDGTDIRSNSVNVSTMVLPDVLIAIRDYNTDEE